MAKVGRASRNASLKRVESITAAKTITASESGEVYFINYNTGADIDVFLPPVKAGAYCKFVWATEMVLDAASVTIFPPSGAVAGVLKGILQTMEVDGTGPLAEKDNGSAISVTIDGDPDVNVGSYIDAICDGTSWHLSGIIFTDAGAAAADCVTWNT